jgi:hypothetical protein
VGDGLFFFAMLLTLKLLVRKQWIAALGLVVFFTFTDAFLLVRTDWTELSMRFAWGLLIVVPMLRFGLFASVIAGFASRIFSMAFLTTDFSMWYGKSSLVALIVLGVLAFVGLRLSLPNRPRWSDIKGPAAAAR